MPATSHRHNALLSTSQKPIVFEFCTNEVGSNIQLGCQGFMTPHSLLEVRTGMLMMKNLKQHFDSREQTAIQTQPAPYYGQDAKRVTAHWEGHDFVVENKAP